MIREDFICISAFCFAFLTHICTHAHYTHVFGAVTDPFQARLPRAGCSGCLLLRALFASVLLRLQGARCPPTVPAEGSWPVLVLGTPGFLPPPGWADGRLPLFTPSGLEQKCLIWPINLPDSTTGWEKIYKTLPVNSPSPSLLLSTL